MICPMCDYAMEAFDKECPRCHGQGIARPAPVVAAPPPPPQPVLAPAPVDAPPAHYSKFCPHCSAPMSTQMTICPVCRQSNKITGRNARFDRGGGVPSDSSFFLGLAGSIMLGIGVFLPVVTVPIFGSINYFGSGQQGGSIVLVLAAVSLVLALTQNFRVLLLTGVGSLGLLALSYFRFKQAMSQLSTLSAGQADNPFLKGMSDVLQHSIQISYGFPVMVIGGLMLLGSGLFASSD